MDLGIDMIILQDNNVAAGAKYVEVQDMDWPKSCCVDTPLASR